MLGSNDDAEPAPASTQPFDEIVDEIPEPDAEPAAPDDPVADEKPEPGANASPQEVLDRLTQYAAEHVPPPEATPDAPPAAPPTAPSLEPVADDLLPRGKRGRRG
jgi:hypothetical protein